MLEALVSVLFFALFAASGILALAVIATTWHHHAAALPVLRSRAMAAAETRWIRQTCIATDVRMRASDAIPAPVRLPVATLQPLRARRAA